MFSTTNLHEIYKYQQSMDCLKKYQRIRRTYKSLPRNIDIEIKQKFNNKCCKYKIKNKARCIRLNELMYDDIITQQMFAKSTNRVHLYYVVIDKFTANIHETLLLLMKQSELGEAILRSMTDGYWITNTNYIDIIISSLKDWNNVALMTLNKYNLPKELRTYIMSLVGWNPYQYSLDIQQLREQKIYANNFISRHKRT